MHDILRILMSPRIDRFPCSPRHACMKKTVHSSFITAPHEGLVPHTCATFCELSVRMEHLRIPSTANIHHESCQKLCLFGGKHGNMKPCHHIFRGGIIAVIELNKTTRLHAFNQIKKHTHTHTHTHNQSCGEDTRAKEVWSSMPWDLAITYRHHRRWHRIVHTMRNDPLRYRLRLRILRRSDNPITDSSSGWWCAFPSCGSYSSSSCSSSRTIGRKPGTRMLPTTMHRTETRLPYRWAMQHTKTSGSVVNLDQDQRPRSNS